MVPWLREQATGEVRRRSRNCIVLACGDVAAAERGVGWGAQDAGLGGQVYDRESIMKGMAGMSGMPGMGGALCPPSLWPAGSGEVHQSAVMTMWA